MSWKKGLRVTATVTQPRVPGMNLGPSRPWSVEVEIDRDANPARNRDTVFDLRVETPLAGCVDRRAVQVAVATGLVDVDVDHVALRIDADDQDHRALDLRTQRARGVGRRVARLRRRIDRTQRVLR